MSGDKDRGRGPPFTAGTGTRVFVTLKGSVTALCGLWKDDCDLERCCSDRDFWIILPATCGEDCTARAIWPGFGVLLMFEKLRTSQTFLR